MEKQMSKNEAKIKAKNKEKMWEQFPDTFWENVFLTFSNLGNDFFQIDETSAKSLFPNPGKIKGIFRP